MDCCNCCKKKYREDLKKVEPKIIDEKVVKSKLDDGLEEDAPLVNKVSKPQRTEETSRGTSRRSSTHSAHSHGKTGNSKHFVHEEEDELIRIIKESKIEDLLEEAEKNFDDKFLGNPDIVKISKENDQMDVRFQVGDAGKEKFHKIISSYSASFDPKWFFLRNCCLSEQQRVETNTNLESYKIVERRKIGDIYYLLSHTTFKKIMLVTKKESVCLKAGKVKPNGDVIEINISVNHKKIPISAEVDRIHVIENPVFFKKTETGLLTRAYNHVLPKTSVGFLIMKPLINSGYNKTLQSILKIMEADKSLTLEQFEEDFKRAV